MRVMDMMGRGGVATKLTSTNTAQYFSAGLLTVSTKRMSGCVIQCDPAQLNSVRVTWGGTTPTQAGPLGIYMAPGDIMRIVGEFNCETFQYISAVAGSASTLQIIPEY